MVSASEIVLFALTIHYKLNKPKGVPKFTHSGLTHCA